MKQSPVFGSVTDLLLSLLMIGGMAAFQVEAEESFSNPVEVCVQLSHPNFYRLFENRLTLRWDWSWEWVPADAKEVILTLKSEELGIQRRASFTDHSVTEVTWQDLFDPARLDTPATLRADLHFKNRKNELVSQHVSWSVEPGAFGRTAIRRGKPGDRCWSDWSYPLVIPADPSCRDLNQISSSVLILSNVTANAEEKFREDTVSKKMGTSWYGYGFFVYTREELPLADYRAVLFWYPEPYWGSAFLHQLPKSTLLLLH